MLRVRSIGERMRWTRGGRTAPRSNGSLRLGTFEPLWIRRRVRIGGGRCQLDSARRRNAVGGCRVALANHRVGRTVRLRLASITHSGCSNIRIGHACWIGVALEYLRKRSTRGRLADPTNPAVRPERSVRARRQPQTGRWRQPGLPLELRQFEGSWQTAWDPSRRAEASKPAWPETEPAASWRGFAAASSA